MGLIFGRNIVPNSSTMKRIIEKLESNSSVVDMKHATQTLSGCSKLNITADRKSMAETPGTFIRHRTQEFDISTATLHHILTKDLYLYPYKVQLIH